MEIIFEIADWNDFDPLNGLHNPKGFIQRPVTYNYGFPQRNMVIKPFLQSYEYLVIGFDQIYNIVKIIPHCNFAKEVFEMQYKNKN